MATASNITEGALLFHRTLPKIPSILQKVGSDSTTCVHWNENKFNENQQSWWFISVYQPKWSWATETAQQNAVTTTPILRYLITAYTTLSTSLRHTTPAQELVQVEQPGGRSYHKGCLVSTGTVRTRGRWSYDHISIPQEAQYCQERLSVCRSQCEALLTVWGNNIEDWGWGGATDGHMTTTSPQ